jgi:hypothetical protein
MNLFIDIYVGLITLNLCSLMRLAGQRVLPQAGGPMKVTMQVVVRL